MRARIAQLAARLMAEDGISDYGLAKRKAARQAGTPDTRNLPDNIEIEQALLEYQQLYQAEEQTQRLDTLRQAAADLMSRLRRFNPHLVGAILSGTAVRYSDVELHLFTDEVKELEMFLINEGLEFKFREDRYNIGGQNRIVHGYDLPGARLVVFSGEDSRRVIRSSHDSRPIDRVRVDQLDGMNFGPGPDK
jgi:hypothetical protein